MNATLNEQIKRGYILFSAHANAPACDILEIVKETEKAIQVEHEETKKTTWLPKSALIEGQHGSINLKKWFKNKAEKSTLRALNIIGA